MRRLVYPNGNGNRPGRHDIVIADSPEKPLVSRMRSAKPLALEYCPTGGDSGGGLFMHEAGQWKLVGICHATDGDPANFMKNGYYGDVAQWTRVSAFAGWIDGVVGGRIA